MKDLYTKGILGEREEKSRSNGMKWNEIKEKNQTDYLVSSFPNEMHKTLDSQWMSRLRTALVS